MVLSRKKDSMDASIIAVRMFYTSKFIHLQMGYKELDLRRKQRQSLPLQYTTECTHDTSIMTIELEDEK
jgi:hypothetical protein